jgi:hypothetical protein
MKYYENSFSGSRVTDGQMDFRWAVRRHANAPEVVLRPYRAAFILFVFPMCKLPCIIRSIRDIYPVLQSLVADYPISRNCVLRKTLSCVVRLEISITITVSYYCRMGVLVGAVGSRDIVDGIATACELHCPEF